MIINGIDCKLKYGYSATRKLTVVEQTTTSNKKFYLDYGEERDDVYASFSLIFTKSETADMNLIMSELITDDAITIECEDGETIFGSEIDYSNSIQSYVISATQGRTSYERYELNVKLIVKNPAKNTSIPLGNINNIVVPHTYTNGYNLNNKIFNGTKSLSMLHIYTDSNIIDFSSYNTISVNAPVKKYVSYNLRTNQVAVPDDWKTYLNAFKPFDLNYMNMEPVIEESFDRFGMSAIKFNLIGVNK